MTDQSDVFHVDITDRAHAAVVNKFLGMAEIAMKLEEVPDFQKVPGFGLAIAIVNREVSDLRSQMITQNLKALVADGVDIARLKRVEFESFDHAHIQLRVTMMDLADMAGSKHDK